MKPITNLLLIFCLLVVPAALANGKHEIPKPDRVNVTMEQSDHNVLNLVAVIAASICAYHRCWKKPVQDSDPKITPEIPKNEYTYEIKP